MKLQDIWIFPENHTWVVMRDDDPAPLCAFASREEALKFSAKQARLDGVRVFSWTSEGTVEQPALPVLDSENEEILVENFRQASQDRFLDWLFKPRQ